MYWQNFISKISTDTRLEFENSMDFFETQGGCDKRNAKLDTKISFVSSRFLNYFLFTNEAVIPHFAIDFLISSVETSEGSNDIFSQFEIGFML